MTTFDNREKAFEDKFAHDAELKFKAEARRNKKLGAWAAEKLGLSGTEVDDYVKAVRKADLSESGNHDLFRKVHADFKAKSVQLSDAEIRATMDRFLAEAIQEVEAGT